MATSIKPADIAKRVHFVRGEKVLLDADLAALYGVETSQLVRAVKRNLQRFPEDFMFQLTIEECLRCQVGISKGGRGGRRYLPYAFSEQGVAMLSTVLRSETAIAVNIEIIRTFVRLREVFATHTDLAKKLAQLESKYDAQFKAVFDAIRELMIPAKTATPKIGFRKPNA